MCLKVTDLESAQENVPLMEMNNQNIGDFYVGGNRRNLNNEINLRRRIVHLNNGFNRTQEQPNLQGEINRRRHINFNDTINGIRERQNLEISQESYRSKVFLATFSLLICLFVGFIVCYVYEYHIASIYLSVAGIFICITIYIIDHYYFKFIN
ncbi:MdBV-4-3 [Microplitis demolitor]|nr:MdBV-4-3 [Microplitis demolitor]